MAASRDQLAELKAATDVAVSEATEAEQGIKKTRSNVKQVTYILCGALADDQLQLIRKFMLEVHHEHFEAENYARDSLYLRLATYLFLEEILFLHFSVPQTSSLTAYYTFLPKFHQRIAKTTSSPKNEERKFRSATCYEIRLV